MALFTLTKASSVLPILLLVNVVIEARSFYHVDLYDAAEYGGYTNLSNASNYTDLPLVSMLYLSTT